MSHFLSDKQRGYPRTPARDVSLRPNYLPQLDGLRGVSVLLVMTHHAWTSFGGWVGVQIFFVLSGYLITSLLITERDSTGRIDLPRFYARRLLRLYPPLIVALIVMLPLVVVASGSLGTGLRQTLIAGTYTTNLYGLVTGQHDGAWAHTWTLGLEEQFYLVWPAVFLLAFAVRSWPRVAVLTLAGVGSIALAVHPPFPGDATFNPLLTSGGLIIGCVLALTRPMWSGRTPATGGWMGAAVLVAGIGLASSSTFSAWAQVTVILGSAALIAQLTAPSNTIVRALSMRPLVLIGRISYELYLWHYALLITILGVWPGHYRLTVVAAYGLALAAATLSHRLVSAPLNRRFKPNLSPMTQSR